MARVLVVGIATLDIINTVDDYPEEDAEVRASTQVMRRGGNACNTAVVLQQLGHQCSWAGALADDASSVMIRDDLADYGVNMNAVQVVAGGHSPTSYVTLNQRNGSRTIVHYRDLPEYSLTAFQQIDLTDFDWLHFEGRNVAQTRAMLDIAQQQVPAVPRSVEIEKPREAIESLCKGTTLLLYSRHYAQSHGITNNEMNNPVTFLRTQQHTIPAAEHICSWAGQGAWGVDQQGKVLHSPAMDLPCVVDTLGAGDTFNAAIIHAKLAGLPLADCLRDACQLAGQKCTRQGFQGLC
ncbi:MAG: PfkB family carbohydrate kinase [Gammaproteobacteria bacterium]|nr:PfkB family carbohydrate kinase [Gammaproteobacteria bacterium]